MPRKGQASSSTSTLMDDCEELIGEQYGENTLNFVKGILTEPKGPMDDNAKSAAKAARKKGRDSKEAKKKREKTLRP